MNTYQPGDRVHCHMLDEDDLSGTVERVDGTYIWILLDDPNRQVSFGGVLYGGTVGRIQHAVPVRPEEAL